MGRVASMAPIALAVLLAGCHTAEDPIVVCADYAAAAITVTIVDSTTGNPTLFHGLWVRARDGAYVDSLMLGDVGPQALPSSGAIAVGLAYERKGTYAVAVHADGYQDWSKSGVVVTADACHVHPVPLTARLARP